MSNHSAADASPHSQGDPAPETGDWVAIGDVVGSFGVRGELKVQPLTDFPERFEHTSEVFVGERRVPFQVLGAHQHKQLVLLHLAGVNDPESAARLRGVRLWIPESQITPLPADQYYWHDLIGLRVRHVNGTDLGVVVDIMTAAGNDLLVVRDERSGVEALLPAVKAFVKTVDLSQGIILVDPIPGLFDERFEEAK